MIIKPEFIGPICKNPHPFGCKISVQKQIDYALTQPKFKGAKKALIIGASSGYGLATRAVMEFGSGADTIGVSFEVGVTEKRAGTAGWWNNIWYKEFAAKNGKKTKNFVGDAFGAELKNEVIKYIKEEFGGKVDLVIYSLASGRRTDPKDGLTYTSALRSIDSEINAYTLNLTTGELINGHMGKATQEDIDNTVKVMGGEDWKLWIDALSEAGVIAEGCKAIAYSYEGPKSTYPIYEGGTIGLAKRDLEKTAFKINDQLKKINGEAFVAICKAMVTKASAFIPLFPVYASILFRKMKEKGTHEDCVQQIERLFKDMVYGNKRITDRKGRVRSDNLEMEPMMQAEIEKIMYHTDNSNLKQNADVEGFLKDFLELNGFGLEEIDYDMEVDLKELAKLEY
ncbi:MAG TPA: enoyl-[acyl-carrier-protein] reductase FabV [Lentisphaeria bacterium]|nr:MAG: trans-2-enoyl-CoA reductase [Lentisphaerae bacterium GWF2_38_69]HBM14944.1 enoyl-[acyl-carrier-protein] reductase FabV [Lentisphaeria bacterium]